MKISIKEYIEDEIKDCEIVAKKAMNRINTNFNYAFENGYCEDLFKNNLIKSNLDGLLEFILNQPERIEEWLLFNIEGITMDLLDRRLQGRSTSEFANLTHTYELECKQHLHKLYSKWLGWIKEGTPIIN